MAPENTNDISTPFANPFAASGPFVAPELDEDGVEADEATEASTESTAPAGVAFGLVFQAPDLETRVPRPERSRQRNAEDDVDTDADADENTDAHEDEESSPSDTDEEQTPRRRRRGGRGRRAGKAAADESGEGNESRGSKDAESEPDRGGAKGKARKDETSDDHGSDDDGHSGPADQDDSDDSTHEDGGSRKRTRRRRRSGSGGSDQEDPNTVTKVREPRKARDEVASIKGSTRLEAKKQRRREGREAGRRRTVITEAEFLARRESVERVMVVRERDGRTQIGVLEDGVLAEHYVSRQEQAASMAGNIYLGRVQNVLPSMEAAFVDIGRGRNAVLYAGEVNWDAAGLDSNQPKRIEHALKAGDSVLVQVTKDPIGHKGARLTSQISLPGRYLVYVPGNAMTGISRKLPDTERSRLKKILKEVVPAEAGVIVRTAAEGASEAELRADVERQAAMWEKIQKKAESGHAPSLLHGEPDLTVRVIRDVFNEDFSKMIVSGDRAWDEVHSYISDVAPDLLDRLQKWTGEKDVFAKHRVDEQLAKAMDRKVWLPSGGSLVIDRTEAMTVIDVNTGKFVGSGGNLEETVTKNNIEAAEEIVRQLRLRDIGGIIVVDFIDMVLESNRDLVVRRLLECLGRDRTKHQVAEVTSLGLVQMTRKRVGSGLIEVFSEQCDHCNGRGIIVHDSPVENRDINGNETGRKSRGRRGNTSGDQGRGGNDKGNGDKNSGLTPAQIAAAAHAAAVAAGEKPDDSDEGTTPDAQDAVQAPTPDAAVNTPDSETAAEPARAPRKRRSRRAASTAGGPTTAGEAVVLTADEPPVAPQTAQGPEGKDAPVTAPEPAVQKSAHAVSATTQEPPAEKPAKRPRRRAGASTGGPVTLQPVDLSAPAEVAAPLTTVAGESSTVVTSTSAEPKPEAATGRRKRARVVSPAGSPTGLKSDD